MALSVLVANWRKPRKIVLHLQQSASLQFYLMAGLAFLYFIQASLFILSLEKITFAPLMSLKGLKLIIWFLFSIGAWSFVVIYAATFTIWLGAKCVNGRGTLPQSRAVVVWTFVNLVPIGFFLLLIYYTFTVSFFGRFAFILRMACYLGILATLIYGFIGLVKMVSETHGLSFWRAFFAAALGLIVFSALIYISGPYLF